MLNIISIKEPEEIQVLDSGYVPFIAEFKKQKISVPLYWRTGNFKDTLIEIAINPDSGCISEISIVMLKSISSIADIHLDELLIESFLPIIDVTGWPEDRFLDVESDFEVYGSHKYLRVMFFKKEKITKIYRSFSVDFLVGKGDKLIGIGVAGVNIKEISLD
ncbi:hypothetical protein [uncultured Shewanella sp.]|uniref:hypothetical protein n=1 Tax=uncultured Shewanella sp. TaxID=173975 RepID=UPI0026205EA7|nr:hypothetical protein [uncultured Shewanella sp.]